MSIKAALSDNFASLILVGVKKEEVNGFTPAFYLKNEENLARLLYLPSAAIEKELAKSGNKINLSDILIAGICKKHNWAIVTLDEDFAKVNGLNVIVL